MDSKTNRIVGSNRILHGLEYSGLIQSKGEIYHYTCNPPPKKMLDKFGIYSVGVDLGCEDNNGILMIPVKAYEKNGIPVNNVTNWTLVSEQLLRILGEKSTK